MNLTSQLRSRKLTLRKETLRQLTPAELKQVAGGWLIRPPITWSCPQPSASECCPKQP